MQALIEKWEKQLSENSKLCDSLEELQGAFGALTVNQFICMQHEMNQLLFECIQQAKEECQKKQPKPFTEQIRETNKQRDINLFRQAEEYGRQRVRGLEQIKPNPGDIWWWDGKWGKDLPCPQCGKTVPCKCVIGYAQNTKE